VSVGECQCVSVSVSECQCVSVQRRGEASYTNKQRETGPDSARHGARQAGRQGAGQEGRDKRARGSETALSRPVSRPVSRDRGRARQGQCEAGEGRDRTRQGNSETGRDRGRARQISIPYPDQNTCPDQHTLSGSAYPAQIKPIMPSEEYTVPAFHFRSCLFSLLFASQAFFKRVRLPR
jgi:hypothetical protein